MANFHHDDFYIGTTLDVIGAARKLGMGYQNAAMVVPNMWQSPATSDPYAPPVLMLVEGIQNYLARKFNYKTRQDGFVDAKTAAALRGVAGRKWKNKPWIVVVSALIKAPELKIHKKKGPSAMGYARTGLGALPGYPAFRQYGSVCKPADASSMSQFKSIQSLLKQLGYRVSVDGDIGPQTLAAVNNALGKAYASCDYVASNYATIHASLYAKLATPGAIKPISTPGVSRPSAIPGVPGTPVGMAPKFNLRQFLSTPMGMVAAGGATLGALLLLMPPKKRGKARS